jgi:hypothetical protein
MEKMLKLMRAAVADAFRGLGGGSWGSLVPFRPRRRCLEPHRTKCNFVREHVPKKPTALPWLRSFGSGYDEAGRWR